MVEWKSSLAQLGYKLPNMLGYKCMGWFDWWEITRAQFLRRNFVFQLLLDDLSLASHRSIFYQQDGALAHNAQIVQEFLRIRWKMYYNTRTSRVAANVIWSNTFRFFFVGKLEDCCVYWSSNQHLRCKEQNYTRM